MGKRKKKLTVEEAEEYLIDTDPAILDTDPRVKGKVRTGTMISFMLPKFSRALGAIQRRQFDGGKVQKYGQIVLDDGTLIEPNKVYNLPLTFEIRDMLKRGLLMGGSRTWVGR